MIEKAAENNRIKVLSVVGPTASGKTALAISLAKRYGGEIVSCDSMQIYRTLDIGTAKPTESEKEGIPHHLIDVASIDESFSCAEFCTLAIEAIDDIASRGKLPILCGGTGLYVDSVLSGNVFSSAGEDSEFRRRCEEKTNAEIFAELSEIDPESAAASHPNNRKRNIRALEIYYTTGEKKSVSDARSRKGPSRYDAKVILLYPSERASLYERIDRRVDLMMSSGLLDEARRFYDSPVRSQTASQAIGYKELFTYFDGASTLEEAVDKLKQASRNYAKRQLTWFMRREDAIKIDVSNKSADEVFLEAVRALEN